LLKPLGREIELRVNGRGGRGSAHGGQREGAGRPRVVRDPVRLAIDHEREDAEALQELAEARSLSVAHLVREAVRSYLRRTRRR
jgi:hypothetical protein